jgi:hypothetical protein
VRCVVLVMVSSVHFGDFLKKIGAYAYTCLLANQICGGPWRSSVFKTSTSASSWTSYGCVAEGTTGSRRALVGAAFVQSNMTPQLCQNLCSGYQYAGVEYR